MKNMKIFCNLDSIKKSYLSASMQFCIIVAGIMLVGVSIGECEKNVSIQRVSMIGLPPLSDQQAIISNSKRYTSDWVEANFQHMFALAYPGTVWTDPRYRKRWLRFVARQRLRHSEIGVAEKPINVHCVQIYEERGIPGSNSSGAETNKLKHIHGVGLSNITCDKLLITSMPSEALVGGNIMSQYIDKFTLVEFSLHQKSYFQAWVHGVHDKSRTWKCLELPLDLDQKEMKNIQEWG